MSGGLTCARFLAAANLPPGSTPAGRPRPAGAEADAGTVAVTAGSFLNAGVVRADGPAGGTVTVNAGNVLQAGTVSADGTAGAAGTVRIAFTGSYVDTAAARTSADGVSGGT